jgi:hypothetical protein
MTVLLHDVARELPSADHEHFLVVLFQLLDQADEIAVAADDDECVDVGMGEGHLERVEGQIDVGAVLVAARREIALHHLDGVLREQPAVLAGALPVAVGRLGDDLAALFERLEHETRIEGGVEGVLDADFDVVEIDEDCETQSGFCHVTCPVLIPVVSAGRIAQVRSGGGSAARASGEGAVEGPEGP